MIFSLYPRVLVKLGGESHVFDRSRLMLTEVQEIERITGLSYGEWTEQLSKYSITAVAALLHVLRKREGMPSDFGSMQFNVAELDCIPLHEDGREFTPAEVAADITRRVEEANAKQNGAGPTRATAGPVAPELPPADTTGISPSSPPSSTSARGNGNTSRGRTSAGAKPTSTRS